MLTFFLKNYIFSEKEALIFANLLKYDYSSHIPYLHLY